MSDLPVVVRLFKYSCVAAIGYKRARVLQLPDETEVHLH